MAAPEGQYRLPLQTGTLILPGAGSTEHCNLVRTALDNITSANRHFTQHSIFYTWKLAPPVLNIMKLIRGNFVEVEKIHHVY